MIEIIIGLVGAIIGGIIASIPIYLQEKGVMERWKIERKIAIIERELEELEKVKKLSLKDLNSLFKGGRIADNDDYVLSVPMEIIDLFRKYLPDQKQLSISELPKSIKDKLFVESATIFENKTNSLKKEIKKLLFV